MNNQLKTNVSRAWLLDFGNGLQAAVGYHEMWQILISQKLFDIPVTPSYCNKVLIFQERILPVIDMSTLLKGKKGHVKEKNIIGIALYQNNPSEPIHYTGLYLANTPQSITVSDEQACELPTEQSYWAPLALSCFSRDGNAIPIINLAYLFSEKFKNLQFSWKFTKE